jgi:beta-glucanase (GH16 family)
MLRILTACAVVVAVGLLLALVSPSPTLSGPNCERKPNHPLCQPPTPAPTATPTASAIATPTPQPTISPSTPSPTPAGSVTFFDDFNTLGAHWLNAPCGPFGAEVVEFRNDLATVSNGALRVRAERIAPNQWRGGHVSTWGDFQQEFGVFEARIKVPVGKGLWPAFWVLKSGAEPCRGGPEELDVMEILANPEGSNGAEDVSLLFQTLHGCCGQIPGAHWYETGIDLSAAYHVYGMEWRENFVQFYLDGQPTLRWNVTIRGTAHLRLDLAVGGWPGPSDTTTPNPSTMEVDWVRVSR